jgi:hypothetical protein
VLWYAVESKSVVESVSLNIPIRTGTLSVPVTAAAAAPVAARPEVIAAFSDVRSIPPLSRARRSATRPAFSSQTYRNSNLRGSCAIAW